MKNKSVKVLFVDDCPEQRELMQDGLNRIGYDIECASSANLALDMLESKLYDIVITDMCMPGMNGLQLCSAIKNKYNDLKVIILTGFASLQTALESIESMADDFLVKPMSFKEINLMIQNTILHNSMIK